MRADFGSTWLGPTRSIQEEAASVLESANQGALPGSWTSNGSSQFVWRTTIRSSGARATRIHFENATINGQVYVYEHGSPPGSPFAGPYSGFGPQGDGDFWSELVFSEAVTVEYVTSDPQAPLQDLPFQVDEIAHIVPEAFPFLGESPKDSSDWHLGIKPRSIAGCHLDVSCYPDWASPEYKSVALLVITSKSGTSSCTGTLINPSYKTEKYLLLLTASHCVGTDEEAENIEFIWNYQTDECYGQPKVSELDRTYGSILVIAKGPDRYDDYSLLLLDKDDVLSVTGTLSMGWSARSLYSGTDVVNVSHPNGAFQRIAFGEITYTSWSGLSILDFNSVKWKRGTTEAGSSGSGVFNEDGQLIGVYGYSNGEDPCSDDYRGAYNELSSIYYDIDTYLESESALDKIVESRIEISLGISGDSVIIRKTDSGKFTRNDEPFSSGSRVTASNGNVYVLSLSTNGWSAKYAPPPPAQVMLGSSGDSLYIHRRENGSYHALDKAITSGSTFTAENGNMYMLNLVGHTWTATYKPLRVHVLLGSTGSSVALERSESGDWWRRVQDGQIAVSNDLQVYRLTRTNGSWKAEPVTP